MLSSPEKTNKKSFNELQGLEPSQLKKAIKEGNYYTKVVRQALTHRDGRTVLITEEEVCEFPSNGSRGVNYAKKCKKP